MGAALPTLGVPIGSRYYDAALEGLVLVDEQLIREKNLPPLYESGARYRVTGSREWRFADQIASEGWGDCEGLAPYRTAELRISGEDPGARVATYRTGPTKFHAVVERSTGQIEDPSAILGMEIKRPDAYLDKIVNNFGPVAVSGVDGEEDMSADDFYNAPPPNEQPDDEESRIDDFYNQAPLNMDSGPGWGDAESTWAPPPPDDGGGGGGGGGSSDGGGGPPPPQQPPTTPQRPGAGQQGAPGSQQTKTAPGGGARAGGGGAAFSAAAGKKPAGGGATRPGATRPTAPRPSTSSGPAPGYHAAPPPPASKPAPKPVRRPGAVKGRVHGEHNKMVSQPIVWVSGPEDFDDDYRDPDAQEEFGEGGDRDLSMDVSPIDDGGEPGYVSTVQIPLSDGRTVNVQSTKASTAKKAAQKAYNIARIAASDPTIQALLPPSAQLTIKALQSSTAKKIADQFHW